MGHWNNRVCKETTESPFLERPLTSYTIREVFYNDKGDICGVTQEAIGVYADNEHYPPEIPEPSREEILREMKETIDRFAKALSFPIVDLDTIEFAPWSDEDEKD